MKFLLRCSLRVVMCSLIMASIFPTPAFAQRIVVLAAEPVGAGAEDVQASLQATNRFTQVDLIHVEAPNPTPTLATLLTYDAVLTWSDSPYAAPDAVGDVLSQYVDAGHGVVQATFAFFDADPTLNLGGRWRTSLYDVFSVGSVAGAAGLTVAPLQPAHPILQGVLGFAPGMVFLGTALTVVNGGDLLANWSNGEALVAARVGPLAGRVVGLNAYPPLLTDPVGTQLMANALAFAASPVGETTNHPPTANAGGDQTLEATSPAGAVFSLTGTGFDSDGDSLTFAWSGAATGGGATLTGTLAPPVAPSKTRSYTLTLTVSDGHGGTATDDVVVTVTDTTGPVLANVPAAMLTKPATSDAGANVSYGPVTATDAVDGARPVTCSKSGLFPVGDTLVTCSSSDTRGNSTSASFTVRVTEVTTPGAMVGAGLVRAGGYNYEFEFAVRERARESATLRVKVTETPGRSRRDDRFCARTTDFVAFSDDPTIRPGRGYRPQVDTVLFSGMGEWNGRSGYHYEVFAVDDVSRQHESVRITIKAPNGSVVASVDGKVTLGFIESARLRH